MAGFSQTFTKMQAAPSRKSSRVHRGATANKGGLAAEGSVSRAYARRGCRSLAERWRGAGGEVDLIFQDGPAVVFVEVKCARSHAQAAQRINRRQQLRIAAAAGEFLDTQPDQSLTEARFDVALVDQFGVVDVIENAFAAA